MLKKSRIAMLVAGALFAAHAGAEFTSIDDAIYSHGSASGSQQLTVFNPDGSWHSMTPLELQMTAVSDDSWSAGALVPTQATVFNPDGTSYSVVSSDIQVAMLEPTVVATAGEALPEQVTVFEPSGYSYSYELTPVEIAMSESIDIVMLEPIAVLVMDEDVAIQPMAVIDADADLRPTYVAHFVSPPEYTGILEVDAISER